MTKITLITGGSRGLGRSMALSSAQRGNDVVLSYHANAEAAADVVSEIEAMGRKAVALQLDTGKVADFDAFAATLKTQLSNVWGRNDFDHLVNNAGHGECAPIGDVSEAMFDSLMDVHFKGVVFLTQTLLPLLADGGRIVNISSGLTRFSFPGYAAYASAKGAVEVFTHYLAAELGPRGITANTIAPGAIETDFRGGAVRDDAELNQQIANGTALGRVGLPDDIGPVVASLLDESSRWVTGQRIEVSGGYLG
mgnify:FL=1